MVDVSLDELLKARSHLYYQSLNHSAGKEETLRGGDELQARQELPEQSNSLENS